MSRPYQRPTLAEQMGLKPNPNAMEHVFHGGVALTKVYTAGGHPVDSSQPGLPVYHRKIANSYPLIALGIGATLLVFGFVQIGHRGLSQQNIVMNMGLPYGGIAVVTAGMFAFAEGNTFIATAGMTLGGLLGSISLPFVPWTGIQSAYIGAAIEAANGNMEVGLQTGALALYKATGIVFFAAMIPVFIIFLAALRTAVPLAGGALLIVIGIILQGSAFLQYPSPTLVKADGAINIVIGCTLWYSAVAVMLQEEGVNLPVFALPRHDD